MCMCVAESAGRTRRKYEQLNINGLENAMSVKAGTPMLPPALGICQMFISKSHSKHINTQVFPSSELILLDPDPLCHKILSPSSWTSESKMEHDAEMRDWKRAGKKTCTWFSLHKVLCYTVTQRAPTLPCLRVLQYPQTPGTPPSRQGDRYTSSTGGRNLTSSPNKLADIKWLHMIKQAVSWWYKPAQAS